MGMKVKILRQVKRGTFDLYVGKVYELDEREASTLIRDGMAEPFVIQRARTPETADNPPKAERTVSKQTRRRGGRRDIDG
jgi:hypothetical protein